MLREYFIKKQAELLEEKAKIEAVDNSEKIALEVEDFKKQKAKEIEEFENSVKKKYEEVKSLDLNKINDYLEFVDCELKKLETDEAVEKIETEQSISEENA